MLDAEKRHMKDKGGMTIIEWITVVIVVGLLLAIAIPSYLGFRESAQDRSAQADLKDALRAENEYFLSGDPMFFTEDIMILERLVVRDVKFHEANPEEGVVVRVDNKVSPILCLTLVSDSGSMFSIWKNWEHGTHYGHADLSGDCPRDPPEGFLPDGW